MTALGCGEDKFFPITVQEPPTATCPALQFDNYAVLVWQGNDFVGCQEGQCAGGVRTNARACVAGLQTPVLEPGKATRVKVMLFAGVPSDPPAWCGEGAVAEVDFDTPKLDVILECPTSCSSDPCQPQTCFNERNMLCH